MSLFNKNKNNVSEFDHLDEDKYLANTSHVSVNTRIDGNINCANVRIDGNLRGHIFCEGRVVVGPEGVIEGNIQSKYLYVEGTVLGDIKNSSGLVLKSSAKLHGNIDIHSGFIEIQSGAIFNGICQMNRNNETTEHQTNQ